ncbi:hypothetical protein ABZ816_08610 [Actinosynnema sp. NPDC047251]|uniref:hypothetical protein n=1 Tax=Saccharothrix espanaensis TaxID=103731 RepID=UPI00030B1242|nr:hypothetical protein [Saccharothrix espanaensis]
MEFEPFPFDGQAATRFGTLIALTLGAKRHRLDLMTAAIASARGLRYTRATRRTSVHQLRERHSSR